MSRPQDSARWRRLRRALQPCHQHVRMAAGASRSASTGSSRAAELPPLSPEFSQAATLKSFREAGKLGGDGSSEAGKLGGLTLRSEGKVIKQSESFSLTLQVEEPSVLAFRWSSVTDGPLHFSATITGAIRSSAGGRGGARPPSPARSLSLSLSHLHAHFLRNGGPGRRDGLCRPRAAGHRRT